MVIKGIIFDWVGTLSDGPRNLFPCSERVLQECRNRGYKLGLISLAGHGIKERREDLMETGIIKYFDSIKVDIGKSEKIYLECMHEMNILPEETAVVDDRTVRGIKIGNKLGCPTFWIQLGKYSYETPNIETGEPTYRIDSIEDLLEFL